VLCYATANDLRDDMDAMAVRCTDYWKEQTSGLCGDATPWREAEA
jgi:hypothetical protein